jgi:tetratricopeptide (TPR) repeat protein
MSIQLAPIEVFYSYADTDEDLRGELDKHLGQLRRDGLIATWHRRQIVAGMDWTKALDRHLNTASIILLLVSADFIASDYCYGIEMQRAMERHEAGEAHVIPILLRPVDWQSAPFGKLQALPGNGTPITKWRNRDAAFTDIAQGIRVALQEVQRLAVSTPHTSFPRIWNIPYPRNSVFTGREEILTHLVDTLKAGQATALSQPQALSGLGGVGKTQVAVEYAYQRHQDYQAVFWTGASTRESLVSGYITIAGLLNLPEKDEQDQTIIIKAVLRWLTTHTEWLLILDNADDLTVVREFVPPMFGGCILLTTRAQAMGRFAARIEVDTMPTDIGALFLLRRALPMPSSASLQDADAADVAKAREICEELGGLPLALDQAGAFIENAQCSLQHYQELYRAHRTHLLKQRGDLVMDHPAPVAATWSLSFEKVEQRSPVAADLLRFCAFLHPDAIPVELITKGVPHLGPELAKVSEDEMALDDAIATARAYSLIRRNASENTLSVHRLVQTVLRDAMDEEIRHMWAERAMLSVSAVFPNVEFAVWTQCERYLSHALSCAKLVEQEPIKSREGEVSKLLYNAGCYLIERARVSEAYPLLRQVLAMDEHHLGPEHMDTASSVDRLARCLEIQGEYAEAEALYKRALAIYEQQLGEMHPNTAASLNNLAGLYQAQGKYSDAELLYKRALAIDKKVYGLDCPEIATDLNNLAMLYEDQGKYAEAEYLCKQALAIRERQLGERHPDTASSLNNLAMLYKTQGKYAEAEALYKRALAICEQQLGEMHPETAINLNNLALLYKTQEKYSDTEPLYKRALAIDEKVYGSDHPEVASDLNNLAGLYIAQGKYSDAELLYKRALAIKEEQLGEMHPSTAASLNNLASLYYTQGNYAEAESLFKRVLAICERQLGEMHPSTAASLNNLASLYYKQGNYAEAKPLFKRVLAIQEQMLEETHPNTQSTQNC